MPNFNPFSNDAEDTSFETGMPVTQAAKAVSQAASAQAQKQSDDATKAIVDQLYAPSTPQDQGTDEAKTQHTDASNSATRAASTHASVSKTAKVNPNQTPDEQEKMEKIRHELFGNYAITFKSAPNSAGINTAAVGLDQEMEKERKAREQREMQGKKEEEEEAQRKKEEEEAQKQEMVAPAGKKTGFQMGRKQQEPMALRLAKTKTEINRGASG